MLNTKSIHHLKRQIETLASKQAANQEEILKTQGCFLGRVAYFLTGEERGFLKPLLTKIAKVIAFVFPLFKENYECQKKLFSAKAGYSQRDKILHGELIDFLKEQYLISMRALKLEPEESPTFFEKATSKNYDRNVEKQLHESVYLAIVVSNLEFLVALKCLGINFKEQKLREAIFLPDVLGYPSLAYPLMNDCKKVVLWLSKEGFPMDEIALIPKRKYLAHVFGIEGKSKLKIKEGKEFSFFLEGFVQNVNRYPIKQFAHSFKEFLKPSDMYFSEMKEIQEVLQRAADPVCDLKKIKEKIEAGDVFCTISGFEEHAIAYVITKNKLMVCNRGYAAKVPGVSIYEIPEEKMSVELLACLVKVYSSLDQFQLDFEKYKFKLIETFVFKNQKGGHCTLSSLKCALFALLYHFIKDKEACRKIYKQFTLRERLRVLADYVAKDDDGLWKKISTKIYSKRAFFSRSVNSNLFKKQYDQFSNFKINHYFFKCDFASVK